MYSERNFYETSMPSIRLLSNRIFHLFLANRQTHHAHTVINDYNLSKLIPCTLICKRIRKRKKCFNKLCGLLWPGECARRKNDFHQKKRTNVINFAFLMHLKIEKPGQFYRSTEMMLSFRSNGIS